jgi:large subunit ribosomal protein L22
MEVKAIARNQRVQPRKVRIIADEIRGKSALHAAGLLRYHPSKGARALRKVLISAIANAAENNGLSPETLKIATIMVDEGPRMKRMTAKAMGRGARIIKKTSHITVVVDDTEDTRAVKPHGTKAKARPTFAAPARKKGAAPKTETPLAAEAQPVEETTDTDVEAVTAAEPEEATPVTASDAPEEGSSAAPIQEPVAGEETGPSADEEDNK